MTQEQIDRAVASVMHESLREVRRHGFTVQRQLDSDPDPERPPLIVDWDLLDSERVSLFP